MAGLTAPKKYNWTETNLALFGSDTERKIKEASAAEEPAWNDAGKEVGLQIWRIVNFKVTEWPKEEYGQFFNGDSYIILNTYHRNPTSNDLSYDIHFWIGKHSTQDEYGTAAYKTVELDTKLEGKPIQHREVEGHESDLFLSYFPKGIVLMEGGADSGFNHVEPETYKPRLLHVHGVGKNIVVTQVPAAECRLHETKDVFILDMGLKVYQWNSSGASAFLKQKGAEFVEGLKRERSGKAVVVEVTDEIASEKDSEGAEFVEGLKRERSGKAVVVEVIDESASGKVSEHPFYKALTEEDKGEDDVDAAFDMEPQLWRVSKSEANGQVTCDKVKEGTIQRTDFVGNDVFILDTNKSCYVWIGQGSTADERKNGFAYAYNHLKKSMNPLRPIVILKQGQENKEFDMALAA